ncbi:MAG TPA: NAD(P)/FAD-dependent oxidoreductase [Terracidiphilus sp.]|jgi:all-trans-retinol 13,14-reductase
MATGTPYKQTKLEERWDAIVIGSGMGGLTAAVLLAQHGGKRVLVLERHYEAGGFTHTFRRPGFDWDVGLHYIGQVQNARDPVRMAFDYVTGGEVRWQPMPEVYDRVEFAGQKFDFTAGLERFRNDLKGWFPGEARAIDAYLAAVRACNRASSFYYAEKAVPAPISAVAGGLMRAPYMKWARRTTREVLESFTRNQELIGVLTAQWGDYGLPPAESSFAAHATIAEHYFEGASYPVGGAGVIAAAIAKRIEASGGVLATSAEVSEILVENGKASGVRMADRRELHAPLVMSDAGAANTFERLLPRDVTSVDGLRAQLRGVAASTAHLSLYTGLSKSAEELGLTGTNLWIYPSFDHDANVRRFSRDLAADRNAPFPFVYLSFPSAKDPDFARRHPGKSTIEAIVMVPYEAFAPWDDTRWKRRGEEYEALKQRMAARLGEELVRQVPAAAGHIEHAELSTPLSTRHFMNYAQGEIYGLASTPARYALRSLGARTPVAGLYLAGQDAASLGVAGALFGGVVAASAALRKNLFSTVRRGLE